MDYVAVARRGPREWRRRADFQARRRRFVIELFASGAASGSAAHATARAARPAAFAAGRSA